MAERTVVVSQPMFLPWLGLFEQVRLADVFVHYDDVQLPQGRSFMTRVQLKTSQGVVWLTAPIDRVRSGRTIRETRLMPAATWRPKHLRSIRQALAGTPHADMAMQLAERIYATPTDDLADFNIAATETIAGWLGLKASFMRSSAMDVPGSSSQRLVDLCERIGASQYVTGHGAFHYLDHALFESRGVGVRYMRYERRAYAQPHGEFTPHVTVLDAIACLGTGVRDLMVSDTVDWRMHRPPEPQAKESEGCVAASPVALAEDRRDGEPSPHPARPMVEVARTAARRVVISQSMYFPWVGLLEQMCLADVFVVYDDVQYSKGSFANRVQAKTAAGSRWLTVPLRDVRLGQRIDEVQVNDAEDWRRSQRGILEQAYRGAPHAPEMLELLDGVLAERPGSLGELSLRSMLALRRHLGFNPDLRIVHARDLGIGGSGSQRVLDIVRALGGTEYVTGHGARNYLEHEAFERAGVQVSYMQYRCAPYPQLHGPFTPYVTALDLIANCGRDGVKFIQPATVPWQALGAQEAK